jgi:shikimate dehydrogenase
MTIRKACVIGWPIAHSRSPLIHGHWIKLHGVDGNYERMPVAPDMLGAFFDQLRAGKFVGCNITIPHKETAFALVDVVDDRAQRCGAINTVYRKDNKLHATTTDGIGFCDNVEHCHSEFSFVDKNVFLFGSGGSARPIIDEVLRRGAKQVVITNRTMERAQDLEQHFGKRVRAAYATEFEEGFQHCDLLVNCTSLGMRGEGRIVLPLHKLPKTALVADIVYVPLITDFLHRARLEGRGIVPGLGMLLQQAVPGFEYWFGLRPKVTQALYDLVARDIDPDYRP